MKKKEIKNGSCVFLACYIEREKKRKQIRRQLSGSNGRLTWKLKERKKERKKERIMWSKEKWKESWQVVGKAGWRHNGRFLQCLHSAALLCVLWIYIDSNKEERVREKVRESSFINDTDNFIFQIILNLLHESFVFYYNKIWGTFHQFIYSL